MSWRMFFAGAGLAFVLGACAVVDPVDSRFDTIGRSLAKARNEAIFLNLVRASHDYPLSFATIANVTPTMSNTTSFALPSFLFGPRVLGLGSTFPFPTGSPGRDVIFNNTTASNATAVSTGFSVATQETSAFYQGFLKPIDLQTLHYFIRQGYSRELLFWLFIDYFELELRGAKIGFHYDPPNDFGCPPSDPKHRCYLDWVHIAAISGLTIEELTVQRPPSPAGRRGAGGEGQAQRPTTTAFARFCFSSVAAQSSLLTMGPILADLKKKLDVPITALQPVCGGHWDPLETASQPQPDILPFDVGGVRFKIVPRSAFGVFQFLGAIMKLQREGVERDAMNIPPNRDDVAGAPRLYAAHDDPQLMTIAQNTGAGECFAHTWFNDGDYCVPESAVTTKRIFGLLAQLIAIQTAATDLSITPLVRVLQ